MQKHELHEGSTYAYRDNVQRWRRGEDQPLKATLMRYLRGGRIEIRIDEGPQAGKLLTTRSQNLVVNWDAEEIRDLLESEERERRFLAETMTDEAVAEAVSLALGVAIDTAYASGDRVSLTSAEEVPAVLNAAGLPDIDARTLSPVAYEWEESDDETVVVLPLPVAAKLAARIAERHPDDIAQAVKREHERLRREGLLRLVERHYKPGWDIALRWAGKPPVPLPPKDLTPREAVERLANALGGQGIKKYDREQRAWYVTPEQFTDVAQFLHLASDLEGRVTLQPLGDGNYRLALDYVRDSLLDWRSNEQVKTLAEWELSDPQRRLLSAARAAGRDGVDPRDFHDRTVESLIDRRLVFELGARSETTAERFKYGRVCLTDLGWRVMDHLRPRSARD